MQPCSTHLIKEIEILRDSLSTNKIIYDLALKISAAFAPYFIINAALYVAYSYIFNQAKTISSRLTHFKEKNTIGDLKGKQFGTKLNEIKYYLKKFTKIPEELTSTVALLHKVYCLYDLGTFFYKLFENVSEISKVKDLFSQYIQQPKDKVDSQYSVLLR